MDAEDIRKVAVVGAGLMGHGIAQEFAYTGYDVSLHDLSPEQLNAALANIRRNLDMLADAGIVEADDVERVTGAVHASTSLEEVVADADIVIEAVTENLEVKHRTYRRLEELCPERTIFASNSSTFMPSQMAVATKRPDRMIVTHYFNPPYLVPLVEVVRGPETSDETFEAMFALMLKVGKKPVALQKELPGFIGNRLQIALLRECLSLVEKGYATPEDIDTVVRYGFGRRLSAAGPFAISDIAGWDTLLAVGDQLIGDLDASQTVPGIVKEMVDRGELGVKTGKGFYDWTPETGEALRQRIAGALLSIEKWSRTVS